VEDAPPMSVTVMVAMSLVVFGAAWVACLVVVTPTFYKNKILST
jgi:hypothetical protein